uniref:Uncharacterized protein n=1 Tax=Arundo donax TaxID=35708 RepID=A0A0A9GDF1_ARUDO
MDIYVTKKSICFTCVQGTTRNPSLCNGELYMLCTEMQP